MSRTAVILLYAAALAGGTYSAFRPTFDSGFDRVQAERADGMLNHYLLEHSWRAVSDPNYCGSLLAPPFFYPDRWAYWYSETLIGVAPLYWGLRLGLPDHLAYQWWMILCSALNFAAFAAVVRWFGCRHAVAALGGFMWAFGVIHVGQAQHQQMIPRFWMPLAAYYAWQVATAPSVRALNRCLACLFLQVAACVYSGWFLAVGLAVFGPVAAALSPGGWRGVGGFVAARWWAVLGVLGTWGLLAAGLLLPYRVANGGFERDYDDSVDLLPTVAGWFTALPGARWSEALRPYFRPVPEDCALFSGFGPYLLFAAAAVHTWAVRRRPARPPEWPLVAACLVTAGVWWILTLNVAGGYSAWQFARLIPGGSAIRSTARVYVVVYLFGTLGTVAWLNGVLNRIPGPWRLATALAVVGPLVFEQTGYDPPTVEKAAFYPAADHLAARLRGYDAGYVLPVAGKDLLECETLAMWAGLRANVPVVNGYSGRRPDDYPMHNATDAEAALRSWLAGRFRGRVAVVDPLHPEESTVIAIE